MRVEIPIRHLIVIKEETIDFSLNVLDIPYVPLNRDSHRNVIGFM